MRNFVAKHDFNRAAVHADKSKEPQMTIEDGLDDYEEEKTDDQALLELDRELTGFIYRKSLTD